MVIPWQINRLCAGSIGRFSRTKFWHEIKGRIGRRLALGKRRGELEAAF
jgi:hypothetical protein